MKDKLPFATRKLKGLVRPVNTRVRDVKGAEILQVYGVTNQEGVTVTGKASSEDVSNYIVVGPHQFVYNPYRVNVGSIGLTGADFNGIVSPAYVVFEVEQEANSELLFLYLKSSIGQTLIRWYGDRGGVRSAMRFSDLVKIDFPTLSYEEQTVALAQFKVLADIESDLQADFTYQATLFTQLRQAVLREAVQGRLLPQDPTDEPAAALLVRIRAEKQRLIQQKQLRKEKPLPLLSEAEQPYELPQDWEWVRLGTVCKSLVGFAFKSSWYANSGVRLLRGINLAPKQIDWTEPAFVSEALSKEYSEYELQEGDIVLALDRPIISTGLKVARLAKEDLPALLLQRIARFSPIEHTISGDYLYLWFSSPVFQKSIDPGRSKGIPHISHKDVERMPFPLPPLAEQHRIVAKVTELLGHCDVLEAELTQARQAAQALHAAALREAFSQTSKSMYPPRVASVVLSE